MSDLWLRAETKLQERRTPLTPEHAGQLVALGHTVYVEQSNLRIYSDQHYRSHGCLLVEAGSWNHAQPSSYVLGLKALPESPMPIMQRHIYFAHAYNFERVFSEKSGVTTLLRRFTNGGGLHFDIEFLLDEFGRRVAAFGESAGCAGALISLLLWCNLHSDSPAMFDALSYIGTPLAEIEGLVSTSLQRLRQPTKCLVIGGQGRCGTGVRKMLDRSAISYDVWDRNNTSRPDLSREILEYDVMYNCVYATEKARPFLTRDNLHKGGSLRIICDVSCETSGNNPLPIYNETTSFDDPAHRLQCGDHTLHVIAIDNLPSFIPKESSDDFSKQLFPHLVDLLSKHSDVGPWAKAANAFSAAQLRLEL